MTNLEYLTERCLRFGTTDNECWSWPFAMKETGGTCFISINGQRRARLTHRVSYQMMYGEVGSNTYIIQICENLRCFNPAHLEAMSVGGRRRQITAPKGRRTCKVCGDTKFLEDFPRCGGMSSSGAPKRLLTCRICHSEARTDKVSNRESAWRSQGIPMTWDLYQELMESQDGKCAICGGVNPSGNGLPADHDHDTNELRGLLCTKCNVGLGWLERNLDNAVAYLRLHGKEVR